MIRVEICGFPFDRAVDIRERVEGYLRQTTETDHAFTVIHTNDAVRDLSGKAKPYLCVTAFLRDLQAVGDHLMKDLKVPVLMIEANSFYHPSEGLDGEEG